MGAQVKPATELFIEQARRFLLGSAVNPAKLSPRQIIENGIVLADWWSRLTGAECAECGKPVSVLARACAYCGAKRTRVAAFAVVGALVLAAIAAAVMIAVVASRQQPPAGGTAQSDGDFVWLTDAMNACDTLAAKEPETLHFLVSPLAAASNTADEWRARALNRIGNATLLRSDVTIEGLKNRTLAISKDAYVLSVRDQAQVAYSWDRTVGVAKFSIPDAGSIESFNVQVQYGDKPGRDDWGNVFGRNKGNCYWVNAILAR
jgi:hypothetical protein